MSLTQINDYGIGNVNLTSMMMSMDLQRRDKQAISLTHYDDNLEPKIAAGSIMELGGALLGCDADEPITGWAGIGNDNDVYIKLVPSGTTATAAFTTAAPTWSTSKQGWYDGNDRYIGGLYKDGSGNYTIKWLYKPSPLLEKVIEIGDWDMVASTYVDVAHGLNHTKIRSVTALIRNDEDTQYWPVPTGNTSATDDRLHAKIIFITSTSIRLMRLTAGAFDGTTFDATSYNRGWIYIKYRP